MKHLSMGAPVVAASLFALAASIPQAGQSLPPAPAAAPAAFAQCSGCHTVNRGGANGVGPNLFGLFGRKAGGRAGFGYSAGLKRSNQVWNKATLARFLNNPGAFAAGSTMPAPSLKPAEREAILTYLASLK